MLTFLIRIEIGYPIVVHWPRKLVSGFGQGSGFVSTGVDVSKLHQWNFGTTHDDLCLTAANRREMLNGIPIVRRTRNLVFPGFHNSTLNIEEVFPVFELKRKSNVNSLRIDNWFFYNRIRQIDSFGSVKQPDFNIDIIPVVCSCRFPFHVNRVPYRAFGITFEPGRIERHAGIIIEPFLFHLVPVTQPFVDKFTHGIFGRRINQFLVKIFIKPRSNNSSGRIKPDPVPLVFHLGGERFTRLTQKSFDGFDEQFFIAKCRNIFYPDGPVSSIGAVAQSLRRIYIFGLIGQFWLCISRNKLMIDIDSHQSITVPVQTVENDQRRFRFPDDVTLKQTHGFFSNHFCPTVGFPCIRFLDGPLLHGLFVIRFAHAF